MTEPLPPLTHHEILRLAEPLIRHGLQVDLPACDRPGRRIAFRPQPVEPGAVPAVPGRDAAATAWALHWQLESPSPQRFVLTRRLSPLGAPEPDPEDDRALRATVTVRGPDVAALLQRLVMLPPSLQVQAGAGWLLLCSHEAEPGQRSADRSQLELTAGRLHLEGLTLGLRLKLPGLRGIPADLEITPAPGWQPALPEDLLAVQGWDWARLIRHRDGWSSKLRLRGRILARSRRAEQALCEAGDHLAAVLSAPPAAYHARHRAARWGMVLRRGIPSLTAVLMIVGALMLPMWVDRERMGMWMALHYLPIALLVIAFRAQELSRFEIPPLPRPLPEPSWRGGAAPDGVATADVSP
jgi:hypothetical protein